MPIPQLVSNPRRNSFHGPEEASQTYIEGDFVTLDVTTGEVELFPFDSAAYNILGLAQKDATGTAGEDAPVTQIWPGDIIALDTYDSSGTPGLADASSFIAGEVYELLHSSSRWYAELSAAHTGGQAVLICEGIVQGSLKSKLTDTTRYRGLFRLIDSRLLQHVGQGTG